MSNALFAISFASWPQTVCYLGDVSELRSFLKNQSIEHVWYSYERILVDDVRELRRELTQKMPVGITPRALVIDIATAGVEPQNALLKIIEEPAAGHKIILCFPTLDGILSTIISRVTIIHGQVSANNKKREGGLDLVAWLSMPVLERMKIAESLVKKYQEDQSSGLLRTETLRAIIQLEQFLHASAVENITKLTDLFTDLAQFRQYLQNQGSSPKYILEYLALFLPAK